MAWNWDVFSLFTCLEPCKGFLAFMMAIVIMNNGGKRTIIGSAIHFGPWCLLQWFCYRRDEDSRPRDFSTTQQFSQVTLWLERRHSGRDTAFPATRQLLLMEMMVHAEQYVMAHKWRDLCFCIPWMIMLESSSTELQFVKTVFGVGDPSLLLDIPWIYFYLFNM